MLTKTGFEDAITGTASLKFDVDSNGYLVVDGSGVANNGTKRISFSNIEADAELADIETVIDVFTKAIPGTGKEISYDSLSATFSVKWSAA